MSGEAKQGRSDERRPTSFGSPDSETIADFPVHLPITLGQLLKAAHLVDSGGEAKSLVQAGLVRVNGQVETRRARQLTVGDLVEVAGKKVRIGRQ